MKMDALEPINLNLPVREIKLTEKPTPSFASWLAETVITTNNKLVDADHALQQLASGEGVSLHQTMLKLEEAKLSFQYMEQIRNRLMSAYQELLREQI